MFRGALLATLHGSLVISSLHQRTTESESEVAGYQFGQPYVTYNFLSGHSGFLGRLLIPWLAIRNHRTFHFLLVALPTVVI